MSGTYRLVVSGLAALCVSLTLSACGERSTEKPTVGPTAESTAAQRDPSTIRTESPPAPPDSRSLKRGPYTAEARIRAAALGSPDARTASEAHQALARFGRDAVPALVEVLEGAHDQRAKQIAAGILGEMGVAAGASLPILKDLKLRGPSELSAIVAPVIHRIEQWQACGLVGLIEDAEVHLVGLYKGQKELDLQLGESGHGTTEIEVIVGRAPRPVILVLSAYDPVLWKVGYTSPSSIAGVLVSGYHTQALIGIPRATPHRVLSSEQTRGCGLFHAHSAQNAAQAERLIMALVGRGIDKYYGSASASVVHVGGDASARPGDVTHSPDLTIDDYPVVRGDVPAGEKGIDALQRQGKLRLATARDVAAWSGDKREQSKLASYVSMGRVYVVLGEMTLPSGLFGGHRRDFIVPAGVPKPKGPKAHCNFYYLQDNTFE
jgi:hypothetical protein